MKTLDTQNKNSSPIPIFITLFAFLLLSPVSTALAVQVPTDHSAKMSSFSLSTQKWKNRVLLIFAPSSQSQAYQQQMRLFAQHKPGFSERDLVVVRVLTEGTSYAEGQQIDEASATRLRDRFGIGKGDFRVILVGKDGGTKRRDGNPIQASAIFNEIDAMPMRRQEMRR
ncbi:MAG: DUF4174 domain-containing protein [Rhizonema sp. NSF051]|nr:DUF4174 domain-containing protein [Rhizonema sp. NSF051]